MRGKPMLNEWSIATRREKTDLVRLLTSSLAPLTKHAERKSVVLHVAAPGEIPELAVDRNKLAWCVATLAGNALRYLRGAHYEGTGGKILVNIEHDQRAPESIAISVQDDGPGILEGSLPYLFESRVGVLHADGLALTLIREIVAAHGGHVEVETQTGREMHGTSITLRLPVEHTETS
jgi:signal transduction histidine kinase